MTGKILRLINFLIDSMIYFVIITVLILVFKNRIDSKDIKWISIVLYFLYYFLLELIFKQTFAKMITRSKIISITQNEKYLLIQVFLRTLIRFVPIDIFSYLFVFQGLHDRLSKTTIIKV